MSRARQQPARAEAQDGPKSTLAGLRGPQRAKAATRPRASAGVAVRRAYADALPVVLVLDGYPSKEEQTLLGPNRGTRLWAVAEARDAIHQRVKVEADRQQIGAVAAPVRVTYTFVVPDNGRRDWDNYALLVKPCQDGLVLAGVLPDGDHWQALEGNVRFRIERGQRRLEVVIEAVGGQAS